MKIIKHDKQPGIFGGEDLNRIHIMPIPCGHRVCQMCARDGAETSVDMWDVSVGNILRGFFYQLSDAEIFAETIAAGGQLMECPPKICLTCAHYDIVGADRDYGECGRICSDGHVAVEHASETRLEVRQDFGCALWRRREARP